MIDLACGVEEGGIACKSYQATLAVLFLLCRRLSLAGARPDDLRRAASAQAELFATRDDWLGRSPIASTAGQGSG